MSDPTQNPPGQPDQHPGEGYSAPPGQQGAQQPGPSEPPGAYQQGYPPAPAYGGAPAAGGVGQPADLLMRFLARLIDGILIGIVNLIIGAIIVAGVLGLQGGTGMGFGTGASYVSGLVSAIISTALYLGYFVFLESRDGQTLGKRLLKLQTQGPAGGPPTTEQALKRNLWNALSLLAIVPVVGGVIGGLASLAAAIAIAVTISSSPTKQGWHDEFAGGTKVIKIG